MTSPAMPLVTVAVCTRERPADLDRCLLAIERLTYPNLDLLVIDNAPRTAATREVVQRHLRARYVHEPRPGLDWARNRAILECRGSILAYTDDDVEVDAAWVDAIVDAFAVDGNVMAVTGLVLPAALDTDAQQLFETYGGFGRGPRRRWMRARSGRPAALEFGGSGSFGTGANMAYRREVFDDVGGFDPALDVGTAANGGGDLEMFFRVLKHGHTLVYEPAAVVRHHHRRDYAALRTQIANNGVGFYAYLTRTAVAYADERLSVLRFGTWWFYWWSVRRLARALFGRETVPTGLVWVELLGSLRGPFRYLTARKQARRIAAAFAALPSMNAEPRVAPSEHRIEREAVRRVDLAEPLQPLTGIEDCRRVRVFVFRDGMALGRVTINNRGANVTMRQLRDALDTLPQQVRDADAAPVAVATLPPNVPVSVIVATYDRPDDLRGCLESLIAQRTGRRLEIVVVDNHPLSGMAASVIAEFPTVRLISEARGGLSYARNAGIRAATGEILLTTDDDVVCPPDWVERLVRPFSRHDVAVVAGNVLPIALETRAQQLFEDYGGLGRGFVAQEFDATWLRRRWSSVPTWQIGATANAAFRASIFRDPRIGLMDEALGAGTPTGCSEDTLVFYRVLQTGATIVYEPHAYVWHHHRKTMASLRRQLYNYSKGHVAYHLTTLIDDRDPRALVRLFLELPAILLRRLTLRLLRRSDYPLRLIALEMLGNLAGPFALWRSRRRVRALGASPRLDATPLSELRSPV